MTKVILRYSRGFLGFLRLLASILPLRPVHVYRRHRPRGFLRNSHERPSSSWHQCSEHHFSTCTLYVHPARLRDFDIMNVDVRLELCLPVVLDAANILIRDTCPRYSKTSWTGITTTETELKDSFRFRATENARQEALVRSAFTSLVQRWMWFSCLPHILQWKQRSPCVERTRNLVVASRVKCEVV